METREMQQQVDEIIEELRSLGSDSIKKVLESHGAREPHFGVKISDLKLIQKRVKKNHALALALYDTGISDAMYLAGLIVDDRQMTPENLQHWAENASWSLISESTVAWVAAESLHGHAMALRWIESTVESIAATGWSTLGSLVSITPDERLDLVELEQLLHRVVREIATQPDRVRSQMNGFVTGVGCYVLPLTNKAIEVANAIHALTTDSRKGKSTAPNCVIYVEKMRARGTLGKKRKMAKC